MKVLFVGLGSIGQRHLRNLRSVLGDRLEPMACRSTDRDSVIVDGKIQAGFSLSREYGLKNFHDLDTALRAKPEMVFVTNPSSLHMPVALKAAAAGCHLFLEKPISHHLDGVKELAEIVRRQKVTVMVGYQMRFHPGYQELRQLLRQGQYGKVIAANFSWGTYLPSHHPYEDYRRGYAARRDLGGGVVLGLIHDIDMICDLFGQPLEVEAQGGRLSSLEIDVEDTVEAVMRFQGDAKEFPVNLFLSYARTKEQH
ncbi:MAG TPA: Gfo/Idh/MocA family oxidoreductase, partial [Candidatus Bathyarchaeia archaeon]|nr:Gfo/Idh/MocA family oxidoreductase [Candidatus Bathyarchaeia archaeon]